MPKQPLGLLPIGVGRLNIAREKFTESLQPTLNLLCYCPSYGRLGNQAGAGLYTFASTMGVTAKGNYIFADGRHVYINAPGVIDPSGMGCC